MKSDRANVDILHLDTTHPIVIEAGGGAYCLGSSHFIRQGKMLGGRLKFNRQEMSGDGCKTGHIITEGFLRGVRGNISKNRLRTCLRGFCLQAEVQTP